MAFTDQKSMMTAQAADVHPPAVAAATRITDPTLMPSNEVSVWIMHGVLVLLVTGIVYSIYKAQRDDSISFNLFDLVVGPDGRLVIENCIVMVAFVVHTWAIIAWIVVGVVTTADFTAYGGIWVAPTIAKLIRGRQQYPKEIEEHVKKLVEEAIAKAKASATTKEVA